MGTVQMKEGWKCVFQINGKQFAAAIGTALLLELSACNWDMLDKVHTYNFYHIMAHVNNISTIDAEALTFGSFGPGSGSILEHVTCSSTEEKLNECTLYYEYDGFGFCSHSQDAGLRCGKFTELTHKQTLCYVYIIII